MTEENSHCDLLSVDIAARAIRERLGGDLAALDMVAARLRFILVRSDPENFSDPGEPWDALKEDEQLFYRDKVIDLARWAKELSIVHDQLYGVADKRLPTTA